MDKLKEDELRLIEQEESDAVDPEMESLHRCDPEAIVNELVRIRDRQFEISFAASCIANDITHLIEGIKRATKYTHAEQARRLGEVGGRILKGTPNNSNFPPNKIF